MKMPGAIVPYCGDSQRASASALTSSPVSVRTDGLQVDADVTLGHGLVQVLAHVVLHLVAQAEFFCVDGPVARSILLDRVAGDLGLAVKGDIEVLR